MPASAGVANSASATFERTRQEHEMASNNQVLEMTGIQAEGLATSRAVKQLSSRHHRATFDRLGSCGDCLNNGPVVIRKTSWRLCKGRKCSNGRQTP